MKCITRILAGCAALLLCAGSNAQTPGTWTWMHGESTVNGSGNFGSYRVPSPSNIPPARYECAFWTDLNGKFWIFGGNAASGAGMRNDMWMFDPATLEWTWMHGSTLLNQPHTGGTMGVPSPANTPGGKGFGMVAWTGNDGNLWLFGGYSPSLSFPFPTKHDLWKFDVTTLEWTWMKGDLGGSGAGVFGTKTFPDPANHPPGLQEITASWTDSRGGLWMYGGQLSTSSEAMNDMWLYNPNSNNWAWMHGDSTEGKPPVHGTLGVASPSNTPGGRFCYSEWMDACGNFLVLGGRDASSSTTVRNDFWSFDPASLEWTWRAGSSSPSGAGSGFSIPCTASASHHPANRYEHGAQWKDPLGFLWVYGGQRQMVGLINDLWRYDPDNGQFRFIRGSGLVTTPANYGTLGVSSPSNDPGGRMGASAWTDSLGRMWLFGGWSGINLMNNDLWVYVPDSTCAPVTPTVDAMASFTVDSALRCDGTIGFDQTWVGGSFLWQFGDGTTSNILDPTHTYPGPGTYTVNLIAKAAGCRAGVIWDTASAIVHIPSTPSVDIAGTGTFCPGDSTLLTSLPCAGCSYAWSTGDTSASLWVDVPGSYSLTVTSSGCSLSDTISVNVPLMGTALLGPDTVACGASSLSIAASCPACTFVWSTGDTTPAVLVLSSGSYSVTATDTSSGCTASDTVSVLLVAGFSLPADTAICGLQDLPIAGPVGYASYSWSTGDTTPSILVNASGTYALTISEAGCTFQDSVSVMMQPLTAVSLGNDTTLCGNASILLTAPACAGCSYLWSTGDTTPAIAAGLPGTYAVTVNTPMPGCWTSDTLLVMPSPWLAAGGDSVLCEGDSSLLEVSGTFPSWLWSTGSTSASIVVTASGTYLVTATSGSCTLVDSVTVVFHPTPSCSLPADTTSCVQQPLVLDPCPDSASVGAQFLWSTGDTTQQLSPSAAGAYAVTVTYPSGCSAADTVVVQASPMQGLGNDLVICASEPLLLQPLGPATSYLWQDGSTHPTLAVSSAGTYWVEMVLPPCVYRDTVEVQVQDGPGEVSFPNFFTPNGDGEYDLFPGQGTGLDYHLTIVDRWGVLVFGADDPAMRWDGNVKGEAAPEGVYYFTATYIPLCGERKMRHMAGWVTLIR